MLLNFRVQLNNWTAIVVAKFECHAKDAEGHHMITRVPIYWKIFGAKTFRITIESKSINVFFFLS